MTTIPITFLINTQLGGLRARSANMLNEKTHLLVLKPLQEEPSLLSRQQHPEHRSRMSILPWKGGIMNSSPMQTYKHRSRPTRVAG
jgi:hypothetical protein